MGDQVVQAAVRKHFIFSIPRRDLGLQVFSLLESLVTPESDWLWILWHLDLSSFSVTRTGQVSIDLIADNPTKIKQEKTKGGPLLPGQHHPGGSSPPWRAPAGGEATVQPQLLPRVETRGEQKSDLTSLDFDHQSVRDLLICSGADGHPTRPTWQGMCTCSPICRPRFFSRLQVLSGNQNYSFNQTLLSQFCAWRPTWLVEKLRRGD